MSTFSQNDVKLSCVFMTKAGERIHRIVHLAFFISLRVQHTLAKIEPTVMSGSQHTTCGYDYQKA